MKNNVQYIVDTAGKPTSVVVSLSEWERVNEQYEKLLRKMQLLTGIKGAILEVRKAKKNGTALQSLRSFLNERKD